MKWEKNAFKCPWLAYIEIPPGLMSCFSVNTDTPGINFPVVSLGSFMCFQFFKLDLSKNWKDYNFSNGYNEAGAEIFLFNILQWEAVEKCELLLLALKAFSNMFFCGSCEEKQLRKLCFVDSDAGQKIIHFMWSCFKTKRLKSPA